MHTVHSLFYSSVSCVDGGFLCLSDLVHHFGVGRSNRPSRWVPREQEWVNCNRQAPPLVGKEVDLGF